MAAAVIDRLELIEIKIEYCKWRTIALHAGNGRSQLLGEFRPVEKSGQRVVVRQEIDALLGKFCIGDVGCGADIAAVGSQIVKSWLAGQAPPFFLAAAHQMHNDVVEGRPVFDIERNLRG